MKQKQLYAPSRDDLSQKTEDWPAIEEVTEYRRKAYNVIRNVSGFQLRPFRCQGLREEKEALRHVEANLFTLMSRLQ